MATRARKPALQKNTTQIQWFSESKKPHLAKPAALAFTRASTVPKHYDLAGVVPRSRKYPPPPYSQNRPKTSLTVDNPTYPLTHKPSFSQISPKKGTTVSADTTPDQRGLGRPGDHPLIVAQPSTLLPKKGPQVTTWLLWSCSARKSSLHPETLSVSIALLVSSKRSQTSIGITRNIPQNPIPQNPHPETREAMAFRRTFPPAWPTDGNKTHRVEAAKQRKPIHEEPGYLEILQNRRDLGQKTPPVSPSIALDPKYSFPASTASCNLPNSALP